MGLMYFFTVGVAGTAVSGGLDLANLSYAFSGYTSHAMIALGITLMGLTWSGFHTRSRSFLDVERDGKIRGFALGKHTEFFAQDLLGYEVKVRTKDASVEYYLDVTCRYLDVNGRMQEKTRLSR